MNGLFFKPKLSVFSGRTLSILLPFNDIPNTSNMNKKNILLAIVPESIPLMERALGNRYNLTVCTTMEKTQEALKEKIDLIIAGLQFNECQMFGFQQSLMLDAKFNSIPFISMKSINCGKVTETQIRSIATASRLLGAVDFIDLYELLDQLDEESAFKEFNSRITLVLR
jgi:hypothetical protein